MLPQPGRGGRHRCGGVPAAGRRRVLRHSTEPGSSVCGSDTAERATPKAGKSIGAWSSRPTPREPRDQRAQRKPM
ncbi:MAG: hypothetical protein KA711_03115 [Ideonella sp. WA131b]|nr:hypothetical protein [Ideonella sp. WA131b]